MGATYLALAPPQSTEVGRSPRPGPGVRRCRPAPPPRDFTPPDLRASCPQTMPTPYSHPRLSLGASPTSRHRRTAQCLQNKNCQNEPTSPSLLSPIRMRITTSSHLSPQTYF